MKTGCLWRGFIVLSFHVWLPWGLLLVILKHFVFYFQHSECLRQIMFEAPMDTLDWSFNYNIRSPNFCQPWDTRETRVNLCSLIANGPSVKEQYLYSKGPEEVSRRSGYSERLVLLLGTSTHTHLTFSPFHWYKMGFQPIPPPPWNLTVIN